MSMIHETEASIARRHDREISRYAEELLEKMGARCDRGGCANHSGHEFCSIDAAYDACVSKAEDEMYDRHRAEREALANGAA